MVVECIVIDVSLGGPYMGIRYYLVGNIAIFIADVNGDFLSTAFFPDFFHNQYFYFFVLPDALCYLLADTDPE